MGLFDFDLNKFTQPFGNTVDLTKKVFSEIKNYKDYIARGFGLALGSLVLYLILVIILALIVVLGFLVATGSADINKFVQNVIKETISGNLISFLLSFAFVIVLIMIFFVIVAYFWSVLNFMTYAAFTLGLLRNFYLKNFDKGVVSEFIDGIFLFYKILIHNFNDLIGLGFYFTNKTFLYYGIALIIFLGLSITLILIPVAIILAGLVILYSMIRINASFLGYLIHSLRFQYQSNYNAIINEVPKLTLNRSDVDFFFSQAFKELMGCYFIIFILISILVYLVLEIAIRFPFSIISRFTPHEIGVLMNVLYSLISLLVGLFTQVFYILVFQQYFEQYFVKKPQTQYNKI
ncbi:MAG: hypothetical protein N3E37_01105 [Candidatus Micrarchaeota archaeon]|nr:hypothetical protein [Candidatus Micrarchaeota archaeon]